MSLMFNCVFFSLFVFVFIKIIEKLLQLIREKARDQISDEELRGIVGSPAHNSRWSRRSENSNNDGSEEDVGLDMDVLGMGRHSGGNSGFSGGNSDHSDGGGDQGGVGGGGVDYGELARSNSSDWVVSDLNGVPIMEEPSFHSNKQLLSQSKSLEELESCNTFVV